MATDNSRIKEKLILRKEALSKIDKPLISVLECFAGKSVLWNQIQSETEKKINLFSIELEKGKNRKALEGDNMKYIGILDLNKFDIIDVDAYGSCFSIVEKILEKQYKGIVICTDIQSVMGATNSNLLFEYGITKKMLGKCPTLFYRLNDRALLCYLNRHGVEQVKGYFIENERKKYFYFSTNKKIDYFRSAIMHKT